jgi:hypothetical protein
MKNFRFGIKIGAIVFLVVLAGWSAFVSLGDKKTQIVARFQIVDSGVKKIEPILSAAGPMCPQGSIQTPTSIDTVRTTINFMGISIPTSQTREISEFACVAS